MFDDDTVPSGTYLHLTCTRSSPNNTFRHWAAETNPSSDDAYDNAIGILCSDGAFAEPASWPVETECEEVPTCTALPTPPADSLMNGTGLVELADGKSVFYPCIDQDAILDDGSGLNFMEIACQNTTWGYMAGGVNFTAGAPATWPKCR